MYNTAGISFARHKKILLLTAIAIEKAPAFDS